MPAPPRWLRMKTRLGVAAAVAAFAVSVGFALADVWLVAVALQTVPAYLAGRWDRRRDRAVSVAELTRAYNRIDALEDHINEEFARRQAGRWADDARLVPDDRPDWALLDRKSSTDAALSRPSSAAA